MQVMQQWLRELPQATLRNVDMGGWTESLQISKFSALGKFGAGEDCQGGPRAERRDSQSRRIFSNASIFYPCTARVELD